MMEKDIGSVQRQLAKPGNVLTKYKEAMVGDRGLLYMLYLELSVLLFGSLEGGFGPVARNLLFRPAFRHIGSKVKINRDFSFRLPHCIELHDGCCIGDEVTLNVKSEDGEIILGADTRIGDKVIFSCPGGRLEVGQGTTIGRHSRLGSLMGLSVGKNCTIGEGSYIVGAGHATAALDVPIINQPITCKGENRVGDNVVIGDRVTILDGVVIGDNAIVESDSVVICDVEAGSCVAGVPAAVKSGVTVS